MGSEFVLLRHREPIKSTLKIWDSLAVQEGLAIYCLVVPSIQLFNVDLEAVLRPSFLLCLLAWLATFSVLIRVGAIV